MNVPPKWLFKRVKPALDRPPGFKRWLHLNAVLLALQLTEAMGLWKVGTYVRKR